MKKRKNGFLNSEYKNGRTEMGDYIAELHDYLWRFVKVEFPKANGRLCNYIDVAIEKAENRVRDLEPPNAEEQVRVTKGFEKNKCPFFDKEINKEHLYKWLETQY